MCTCVYMYIENVIRRVSTKSECISRKPTEWDFSTVIDTFVYVTAWEDYII